MRLELWLTEEELLPHLPFILHYIDCSACQSSCNSGNPEQLLGRIQGLLTAAAWEMQILPAQRLLPT